MNMVGKQNKIEIQGLYKVFGPHPDRALEHARAGMSKPDLLSRHGHVLGLSDINVEIGAGEITVIMGLSGSGKSTLIRHLNRLIEPTAGKILVDGVDILGYSAAELRRMRQTKMSMVFQNFALFPHRSIIQNICLSGSVRGEEKAKSEENGRFWLERVGLAGYENHYPGQLSGGMQQRVGVARALASCADTILMDEAYSALDPLIRTDMQGLLLQLQAEFHRTVVFITHDLDEALRLADHLVILKDGQVVQKGDPQEILLNPADSYIEDFVSDINRARVLKVRSVMVPRDSFEGDFAGEVDHDDTLEKVIGISGGETSYSYLVMRDGKPVGELEMARLVRALVPRAATGAVRETPPGAASG